LKAASQARARLPFGAIPKIRLANDETWKADRRQPGKVSWIDFKVTHYRRFDGLEICVPNMHRDGISSFSRRPECL
jgi:hypothetical protein